MGLWWMYYYNFNYLRGTGIFGNKVKQILAHIISFLFTYESASNMYITPIAILHVIYVH